MDNKSLVILVAFTLFGALVVGWVATREQIELPGESPRQISSVVPHAGIGHTNY